MNEIITLIMYFIYGIIIISFIKNLISKLLENYHSKWNTLIDNFNYSPKEFYAKLETELRSHGIENISIKEKYLREGNAFSDSRLYLRVKWKDFQYDICGCKFGNGFFISWWLLYKNSVGKILISKIPLIGPWLSNKLFPVTYYQVDTASMFMSYAQKSVLNVIDDITNNKGVRALTEAEKKPILHDVFKR